MEKQSWITVYILYAVYVVFAASYVRYADSNFFTGVMAFLGITYSFNKVLNFLIWNFDCEQPETNQHLNWVDQYIGNIYHN